MLWLAVGATLMLGGGLPDPAEAATATEILTRAREGCLASQPLDLVVGQAFDAALASGIAVEETTAPMTETVMETYDSGADCPGGLKCCCQLPGSAHFERSRIRCPLPWHSPDDSGHAAGEKNFAFILKGSLAD